MGASRTSSVPPSGRRGYREVAANAAVAPVVVDRAEQVAAAGGVDVIVRAPGRTGPEPEVAADRLGCRALHLE